MQQTCGRHCFDQMRAKFYCLLCVVENYFGTSPSTHSLQVETVLAVSCCGKVFFSARGVYAGLIGKQMEEMQSNPERNISQLCATFCQSNPLNPIKYVNICTYNVTKYKLCWLTIHRMHINHYRKPVEACPELWTPTQIHSGNFLSFLQRPVEKLKCSQELHLIQYYCFHLHTFC